MPVRRGLRAGLSAGAFSVADSANQWGQRITQERGEQRRATLQIAKDVEDKIASGDLDIEQGVAILGNYGIPADRARASLSGVQPSTATRLSGVLKGVENAKSYSDLPTPEGLNVSLAAKRLEPITSTNIPAQFRDDASMGGTFDQRNPEAAGVLGARRRALIEATPPTTGHEYYDTPSGRQMREPDKRFEPDTQTFRTFGSPTPLAPTPAEAGYNAAETEATKLRTEAANNVPTMRGQAAGTQRLVEIPSRVAETTATTTAAAKAQLPFQQAMAKYANELAQGNMQLTTINNPKTGEDELVLVNKRGEMVPVQMPEGMAAGRTRQIPATIADNTAGLNTAEIEGVRILRALRTTGLDRSNDPIDPRFQKFLVNTLNIAPADLEKGRIQQGVGFVNATLTRALMGSRPSQYVAKEIIQPHLPKQEMTGEQLANVLEAVLRQASERRSEFAHTLGVPIERLAPQDANNYAAYLKEQGRPTNAPATLTIGPDGKLVPKPQQ